MLKTRRRLTKSGGLESILYSYCAIRFESQTYLIRIFMGNSWIRGMKKCRFEEKRMCKIFNGQEQWFICAKETFVLGPTCMICFAHIFVPDATVDLEMGLIFESYGILNQRFYRLHPFKVTTPKSSTCKNGTSALCHVRIRKTRYVHCTNCSELILRNPFCAVSFSVVIILLNSMLWHLLQCYSHGRTNSKGSYGNVPYLAKWCLLMVKSHA